MAKPTFINRAILSDILLWMALLAALLGGLYLMFINLPAKRSQVITLHFRDANEITQGSAVRMMGTEVGYVDQLRIHKDHVDVTVRTYPGALPIPSGATFTILFTGIAGGKSIEVELPNVPRPTSQGKPVFLVEEPVRMKHMINYTLDITEALQDGAENIADFFGKKKPVEELQFNIRQSHQRSTKSVAFMDNLNHQIAVLKADIRDNTQQAASAMAGFNQELAHVTELTEPTRLRPPIQQGLANLQAFNRVFMNETTGQTDYTQLYHRLLDFNNANSRLAHRMQHAQARVESFPVRRYLDGISRKEASFLVFLNQVDSFLGPDALARMKQGRTAIQHFNRQVLAWSAKADTQLASTPKNPPSTVATSSAAAPPAPDAAKTQSLAVPSENRAQQEQPLSLADEHGQPVSDAQPRWWHQAPAAQQADSPELTQPSAPTEPPSLINRLVQRICAFFAQIGQAIRFFFQ